ncbi:MAG: GTP-binding protein, partial [Actinobacteria bacterium]|nr:GTP-binding protein [Actinomycetota bacterium]
MTASALDPLAGPSEAGLLRLVTAGSVDDGKSTLIGRLLFDARQVLADQMSHVEETSERRGDGYVNLALLTDGLRAEREQGITIDVAYRSFQTPRRRFILADTPGHVQYTRNMVTGASTADVALILVDARKGVVEQTRRHAYIATLLEIPHLAVCVNKMDLVDFAEARFREIADEVTSLAGRLGARDVAAIPIAALHGDNIVD